MRLALRNRIAEWLLEAVASPAAEEPLRAHVSFSRDADAQGRAVALPGADAATLLHHGEELFERDGGGVRLREPFLGDLEALRARAGRFDEALGAVRRRCGTAGGKPEIPWLLCAAGALFDERLFFEVHELLEPAWGRAAEPLRTFLQGLIQVAVGLHHHENGNLRGAASLLADGGAKLEPHRPRAFGVELEGFCAGIARVTESARVQLASGRSSPLEAPLFPRAAPLFSRSDSSEEESMAVKPAFDLSTTYIHLADGPSATRLEVGDDFWATIDKRTDIHEGRLVCAFRVTESWTGSEMHPAGDEIVLLLSGAIDVVLQEETGERIVELRDRAACIVPRGVWHTARVHAPSEVLHITRGEGTQHRPL